MKTPLILFMTLLPTLGWSDDTPASSSRSSASQRQADKEPKPSEARLERFREALDELSTTTDVRVLHYEMNALRRGLPDSHSVIVEGLRHQSPRVRSLAVNLLGESGEPETDLEPVRQRLWDVDPSVRMAAVMAIRRFGKIGVDAMRSYLPTERESNNRKMAVKNLRLWRDERAIPCLADALKREKHAGVKKFIIDALQTLSRKKFGDDPERWFALAAEFTEREQKEILRRHLEEKMDVEKK